MFKILTFVLLAIALQSSLVDSSAPGVSVVSLNQQQDVDGNYGYEFETSDGTKQEAQGEVKKVEIEGIPEQAVVVHGSYKYISPDGTPIEVTYTADENGYHPVSSAIPQA